MKGVYKLRFFAPVHHEPFAAFSPAFVVKDDIEIVDGEDDGGIYSVEELERMLGPEFTKEKLVSIHTDMDFAVSKNSASTYTSDILEFELKRAAENGVSDIDFSRKFIEEIPMMISTVIKLRKLTLNECKIKTLPADRLTSLTALRAVELRGNALSKFPRCFALPGVESLVLDHNTIVEVPEDDLLGMTSLTTLTMFGNKLKSFPAAVTTMHKLRKLDLECNYIKTIGFQQADFPPAFQLSLDPMVKSGPGGTPKARKSIGSPKSGSAAKARTPKAKGSDPTSPTAPKAKSKTPASKSAKRKSTDANLDLDDFNFDEDDDADFQAPSAKRSKIILD